MAMIVDNKHNVGDVVFLKTDQDQFEFMVTGIFVTPPGVMYELCQGPASSRHYECEISADRDSLGILNRHIIET